MNPDKVIKTEKYGKISLKRHEDGSMKITELSNGGGTPRSLYAKTYRNNTGGHLELQIYDYQDKIIDSVILNNDAVHMLLNEIGKLII